MKRIKELRLSKGLSQAELAKILGYNQTAIGKYERGELEPSIETMEKLCDFFECSIDYLVGREDDFGNVTVVKASDLSEDEKLVFEAFARLNDKQKKAVKLFISGLLSE